MRFILFLSLFFAALCGVKAQVVSNPKDTVYFLNGKKFVVSVKDTSLTQLIVEHHNKPGKLVGIDKDRVYAVHYAQGSQWIVYQQDTVFLENILTPQEMKHYITGLADARKGYKAHWYGISSFVVSGLGAYYVNKAGPGILMPLVPFGYTLLTSIPIVNIKHPTVSNMSLLNEEYYIMGYVTNARKKRRMHSLIGGLAGMVLGATVYSVTK